MRRTGSRGYHVPSAVVLRSDCTYKNIMMDASAMYPKGFHHIWSSFLHDIKTEAPCLARGDVSVKYYYVDFGISSHIPPDAENRLVVGVAGRDQEVPELSRRKRPYDPFKVDIFIIGNLFRRYFHDVRASCCFCCLIHVQCRCDPTWSFSSL